ncbi:ankyrin repeat protein [Diplodia corticola]|uniref:Ankyrin repeat protein n=1 Tax=Diplodia corticola TaxID=236234 RepID=A0A1J9QRV7_9PEZI|nr:ankyrin repeat protein [Diplodia corticola]OJD31678.1 ankyrin repeat protein [Diplodia corticola]
MDLSTSNGNGSNPAPRIGDGGSHDSPETVTPVIKVSLPDEDLPSDPAVAISPSQPPHKLVRSKSLTAIPGVGDEQLASTKSWKPSKRLSFLLPEKVAVPIISEKRRLEKRESKTGQDARTSSPSRHATFQHVIPAIKVRKLSEPKDNTNGCQVDVVVIHMCGNRKKNVDWEMSVFIEPKDKKETYLDEQCQARKRSQLRRTVSQGNESLLPPEVPDLQASAAAVNWLEDQDMLPKALPKARITAFGLDINQSISNSANAPIDLKFAATEILKEFLRQWDGDEQRSIVFIGHGYGTIVIEHLLFGDLLKTVGEDSRLQIVESTAAVVMFSPPLERFDNLISWMANDFNIPRCSAIFEARKANNDRAPNVIWDDFLKKTEPRNIATFGYLEQNNEPKKAKSTNAQPQTRLKRFDRTWTFDTDVDNIARISHANDIRFKNLAKAVSEYVGVHQLLRAGRIPDEDLIDDLLGASIDFNFENGKRQTVLHLAVEQGLDRLVKSLVNSGKVDLDRQDDSGNTALHISIASRFHHSRDMVFHLLKAGANTGVMNKLGKSAEELALEANISIKELFRKRPLVEGPIGPRTLVGGKPANPAAQASCQKAGMVAREVFKPTKSKPERHLPVYKSVHDFIYTDDNIDDFFQAAYHEHPGTAMCRWYHIPMNNMAWDLFAKLKLPHWPWPKPYKRSKIHYGRYMSPEATRLPGLPRSYSTPSHDSWVVFMPYISYESCLRQQQIASITERAGVTLPGIFRLSNLPFSRPRLIDRRRSRNNVGANILPSEDPEALAIKGYLNDHNHNQSQHLTFHVRRTLDQSYYNMLKDTSYRDRTQVVSRCAKLEWQDSPDHNVLMVDQLWLWFLKGKDGKPDTIITSFPSREGATYPQSTREADDLQGTILDPTDRKCISESTDLVSRILSVCCNAFDRHQHLESINFLYFFESAIGRAEEEETRLFRHFRRRANTLHSLHEKHPTYSEHRSMLLKKLLDILKESKLLKEIKDILDEIKMIKSVLKDQYKVVKSLQELVQPHHPSRGKGASHLHTENKFSNVLTLIRDTDESFDVMEAHAKQVENGLEHLLDLKQKQANLWEARSSREGAEEAAKQGKTILVFTVVTIIFLPLSFMASFFSLGVSIFPKQDGENNLPLGWVAAFLFGISFAVSIPFILLAFKIESFSSAWTRLTHSANKCAAFILLKPLGRVPSRRVRAKGQEWYRAWVSFIAKHDLPLRPDGETAARLKRETDGAAGAAAAAAAPPEPSSGSDSSSDGEVSDEEELDLAVRQTERQRNLLLWMKAAER